MNPGERIAFIQHILALECDTRADNYTERDDAIFAEEDRNIQHYRHSDIDLSCHQPTPVTDQWLEHNASQGRRVRQHTLFAIRTYARLI